MAKNKKLQDPNIFGSGEEQKNTGECLSSENNNIITGKKGEVTEGIKEILHESPRKETTWITNIIQHIRNEKKLYGNIDEIKKTVLKFMLHEKLRSFSPNVDIKGKKRKMGNSISDIDKNETQTIKITPLTEYEKDEKKREKTEIQIPIHKLEQVGMILKVLSKLKEMECIPIYYVISGGTGELPNIMDIKNLENSSVKEPLPVLEPGFEEKIIKKIVDEEYIHENLVFPEVWEYCGANVIAEEIRGNLGMGDIDREFECNKRPTGNLIVTEKTRHITGETHKAHHYYLQSKEIWWQFIRGDEDAREKIMGVVEVYNKGRDEEGTYIEVIKKPESEDITTISPRFKQIKEDPGKTIGPKTKKKKEE